MFSDQQCMQRAVALAQRGLGMTADNPAVGCVLVKNNIIIGRGHTAVGGRPHAEVVALTQAGDDAKGATAYVTLEPCSHEGQTPPCSIALIEAGISRVVIGCKDPDERVDGSGIQALENAGVDVTLLPIIGPHDSFIHRLTHKRPYTTLKLATSIDGQIAMASGESQWISNPLARNYAHRLRASHDAIMVGMGTAMRDSPQLTCRLPGLEDASPIRLVLDSRGELPANHTLVITAPTPPTWLLTLEDTQVNMPKGVDILRVNTASNGKICLEDTMKRLAEQGINRLLVEGGGTLASALLHYGLVDEIIWIISPLIIGAEGKPAIGNTGLKHLVDAYHFTPQEQFALEDNYITHYRPIAK